MTTSDQDARRHAIYRDLRDIIIVMAVCVIPLLILAELTS